MTNTPARRCPWVDETKPHYIQYHDQEWGVPVHDDRHHFEMITLEGAQAGLSWETILRKRAGYRQAFHNFNPQAVTAMTDEDLERILTEGDVVRNRLKILSTRKNARVFCAIQEDFGSFDRYLWGFVGGRPLRGHYHNLSDFPTQTPESLALSQDLKKRGMTFVGPTIMYAYMQAVGLVNDHLISCFRYEKITA